MLAGAWLASGCTAILGIDQKDYSAAADASDDATATDGADEDSARADAAKTDGPGTKSDAAADAPADVHYPSCLADGSAGEICGAVTYAAWSACSYSATCDNSGSRTRSVMTPTCSAGACSTVTTMATDTSGCARDTDGMTCGTGMACSGQTCKCAPQCAGKNCGSDGCGGSCGPCSGSHYSCSGAGVCQCTPTPGCTGGGNVGNVCGPDDGCGDPCSCDTANGEMCGSNNVCCHTTSWFCTTNAECCSGSCNIGPNVCN